MIELIKSEIERRMNALYPQLPDASKVLQEDISIEQAAITGKYTALESLLSFVDSVSGNEDLEKVIEKIADKIVPTHPDIGWDECYDSVLEGIKEGAQWKEQQIMKRAISTQVTESYGSEKIDGEWRNVMTPRVEVRDNSLAGDKVKVIVIKEN